MLTSPTVYKTIPEFLAGALQAFVYVAIPIVVLFLVVAGFKFIAAQGNSSKLEEAKRNFLYVIIGALFILGAQLISTLISNTVTQLQTGKSAAIEAQITRT